MSVRALNDAVVPPGASYTFGNALEARRKRVGLTQKELGDRIGVSARTIYEYEQGRGRPQDFFPQLERALGVRFVPRTGGSYDVVDDETGEVEGASSDRVRLGADVDPVIAFFPAGTFEGKSDAERARIIAAAQLAGLREADRIEREARLSGGSRSADRTPDDGTIDTDPPDDGD